MEEPTYTLAIDGDGVAIRKHISDETLRRIMNILLLAESDDNAARASFARAC